MKNYFFTAICIVSAFLSSIGCKAQEKVTTATEAATTEITQPKDFPLIFRRTTLIVRDIDKSLELYRDAIGMEVIYDKLLPRPHPTEDREQLLHLVFLKATNNFYGVLGLMEYDAENPDKTIKPIRKEGFTEQNIVLLFNSINQEEQFKRIKEIKGIELLQEPTLVKYPSYDGKDIIRVMVSKFYDPDGFIVEFNKVLDNL